MKRIAFIDLGSNSVRFVIYEISKTGSYRLIYQEKESVRLSENMWGTHELTKEAMERSLRALKGFVHMADAMEANTIKAVATAAVRLAKNGDAFIKSVKERTGLDLECIAGEEEARLGFLGVINTIGLKDFIIFDLGGASTEITLVRNRHITKSVSLPIGALTLTGTYQKGDEYTPKELDKLTKVVKKTIKEHIWLRNVKLPLLGIGGTARNIAKMDQRKLSYPITKLHNYEIPYHRFYYGAHYLGGNSIIDDILVHSAENVLLGMTKHELVHAKYITDLAIKLYDELEPLHRADKNTRRCLIAASLLHDIGKRINYYSHARHGCYMLVNSNLYGLSHVEQAFSAFLVMNSHGLTPKEYKNFLYGKLLDQEQRLLGQKISIILALAEALDESHEQFIRHLSVNLKYTSVLLVVTYLNGRDISVTKAAVEKLGKSFKKEFKKTLEIEWKEARKEA